MNRMKYELRKFPIKRREFKERISYAERYLFSLGLNDAAAQIGRENAKFFISKMHCVQEKLGYRRRAIVVGAPNFTFQTSPGKFRIGVPEGAKFTWGDGTYDFVPADLEPDFCGMLIGLIEGDLTLEETLNKLYRARGRIHEINGVKIEKPLFWPGSHFLKLYEVKNNQDLNLSRKVVVLHVSSNEMRNLLRGFVRRRAEEIETPFGTTRILRGNDAREYIKLCKKASDFSKRKRQLLFEEIFEGEVIANHNHYDLTGFNEAIIGCTLISEGEISVISLTDKAYLVRGRRNLSPAKIAECLGSQPIEGWVYSYLLNLNILPHGGGHRLPGVNCLEKIILYPEGRVFVLKCGSRIEAHQDMWNVPRGYRVKEILEKTMSLGLADLHAPLQLIYTIKVDF